MDDEILKKIKSKGYWRVVIRPSKEFYLKDRFPVAESLKVIGESQVKLRGWYYPHIETKNIAWTAQNIISNQVDFQGYIENWNFLSSGQFVHLFAMKEDYDLNQESINRIKGSFYYQKEGIENITRFLEVVSTIYRFTEIYLFASNIVQDLKFSDVDTFEIIIELYNLNDRLLFIWDQNRTLHDYYISALKTPLIFKNIYKKDYLISDFNNIALENIKDTFLAFNWTGMSPQVMKDIQDKLINRRI